MLRLTPPPRTSSAKWPRKFFRYTCTLTSRHWMAPEHFNPLIQLPPRASTDRVSWTMSFMAIDVVEVKKFSKGKISLVIARLVVIYSKIQFSLCLFCGFLPTSLPSFDAHQHWPFKCPSFLSISFQEPVTCTGLYSIEFQSKKGAISSGWKGQILGNKNIFFKEISIEKVRMINIGNILQKNYVPKRAFSRNNFYLFN